MLAPRFFAAARNCLELAGGLSGIEQSAVVLAAPRLLSMALPMIEWAVSVDAGGSHRPARAEIDYLAGLREDVPRDPESRSRFSAKPLALLGFRRMKCAARWAPAWRLPRAWTAPEGTVLTHSEFVIGELRARGQAAAFFHADQLLLSAISSAPAIDENVVGVAQSAAAAIAAAARVVTNIGERLQRLLEGRATPILQEAVSHLRSLQGFKRLPEYVLASSGGSYPVRAIGIEVARRGGTVEFFDHGGPFGLVQLDDHLEVTELRVATRFVTSTEAKARLVRAVQTRSLRTQTEIVGGHGDPHFRAVPRASPDRRAGPRRVVFATTLLRGDTQRLEPLLADEVCVSWQRRVMAALTAFGVEASLKPHPWDYLNGKRHPLEGSVRVLRTPVEALIPDTDVFVFDYVQSTAMWSVACSDRPMVLLDLGISALEPHTLAMFQRRCTVVSTNYDSNNIPGFDQDELKRAVSDAPERADPTEFRALLAGD